MATPVACLGDGSWAETSLSPDTATSSPSSSSSTQPCATVVDKDNKRWPAPSLPSSPPSSSPPPSSLPRPDKSSLHCSSARLPPAPATASATVLATAQPTSSSHRTKTAAGPGPPPEEALGNIIHGQPQLLKAGTKLGFHPRRAIVESGSLAAARFREGRNQTGHLHLFWRRQSGTGRCGLLPRRPPLCCSPSLEQFTITCNQQQPASDRPTLAHHTGTGRSTPSRPRPRPRPLRPSDLLPPSASFPLPPPLSSISLPLP